MNNSIKGGRGKRAPYATTHYRMPEPLKPLCEELAANYRELIANYSDPEDPALINAALAAVSRNAFEKNRETDKQVDKVLENYEAMQLEIHRLKLQIESLKSTNKKDNISKAIIDFIEVEKQSFGSSPSQKDKAFSLDTRKWDAFRGFIKFVNEMKDYIIWEVGDKCTVSMPSGATITGGEIVSIDTKSLWCKVWVKDTESHFPAELSSLSKP